MFKLLLVLFLSTQLSFAGSVKLADYLLSSTGVVELLGKYNIKGEDAKAVKSYVGSALHSLSEPGDKNSKEDLIKYLAKLPLTGEDAKIRKELQLLLDKNEAEIKKEDLVAAINNLIYMANRNGRTYLISCADCVNENLAKNGFKFTVETIKNASTIQVLEKVIPANPKDLNTFIVNRMKKAELGDYTKVNPSLVSPTEERSLAVFLALSENTSKDKKAQFGLIEAIKNISKTDNKVNIIDNNNPHKFWRIFSEDMTDKQMIGWTDILNKANQKRLLNKISSEEAFYKVLEERADKSPELKKRLKVLKSKRCFFK